MIKNLRVRRRPVCHLKISIRAVGPCIGGENILLLLHLRRVCCCDVGLHRGPGREVGDRGGELGQDQAGGGLGGAAGTLAVGNEDAVLAGPALVHGEGRGWAGAQPAAGHCGHSWKGEAGRCGDLNRPLFSRAQHPVASHVHPVRHHQLPNSHKIPIIHTAGPALRARDVVLVPDHPGLTLDGVQVAYAACVVHIKSPANVGLGLTGALTLRWGEAEGAVGADNTGSHTGDHTLDLGDLPAVAVAHGPLVAPSSTLGPALVLLPLRLQLRHREHTLQPAPPLRHPLIARPDHRCEAPLSVHLQRRRGRVNGELVLPRHGGDLEALPVEGTLDGGADEGAAGDGRGGGEQDHGARGQGVGGAGDQGHVDTLNLRHGVRALSSRRTPNHRTAVGQDRNDPVVAANGLKCGHQSLLAGAGEGKRSGGVVGGPSE
mmetsp:Transcript_59436/g.137332  ORF Transcript_59436/g.137332 Transcript_59436/m.137332 type:complete len:431 (-) Transcript_59436:1027-2319(-)